jgi:predicted metal-dependent peptidase
MPDSLTEAGRTRRVDLHRIAAARLWATARAPYLASALFALTIKEDPECHTVSVDKSWTLHVDPERVEQLEVEDLGKLLVHLVGHLLRDHAARAAVARVEELKSRQRWNRAADAELNDDLVVEDLVPSVASLLPTELGCSDGQLAEHYFDFAGLDGPQWDCGSGCDNHDRQGDGGGEVKPGQAELLRLGVAAEVHRYAQMHPGTVPGGWMRWAQEMLPSRVDWRRVLAAEVRRSIASVAGNVDYTYRRPSRRQQSAPRVVLPAMHRPIPNVAIVCDTSGSMHELLLGRALAEVEGILSRAGLRQTQVRVLAVDTNVHAVTRVSRASQVELPGGGGTDMGAGIEAASKLRPRPTVIIVLTDGFTPWPSRAPRGVRVVVGILTQQMISVDDYAVPQWARSVRIDDEHVGM